MGRVVPDRPLTGLSARTLKLRLAGVGLGLLGWVSYRVLAAAPGLADTVAGTGPIPAVMRGLSRLSAMVPVPLAEVLILGFILRQGLGAWRGLRMRGEAGDPWLPTLGRGGLRLAQDLGVLVFLFYLLWGVQYARPGLEAHLGIAGAGEVSAEELRNLAARAVRETNRAYLEIHGSVDSGTPTIASSSPELTPGLVSGWEQTRRRLDLDASVLLTRGRPKAFLASPVVKRLGVSGMYFPFTGEALVLSDLPGILQAKDMGHEMAHQRGFASESDANVLGALVAARSPDPLSRYSAYSFIERQLLAALRRVAPADARAVARERSPGVRRDLADLSEYWRPAQTPVAAAATRVNDAMLRSHGVPDGVRSYQGSTWVFVALARQHGTEALFGPTAD